MIALPVALESPPALARPVILAPATREVSFGDVVGRVGRGTTRLVVAVNGRQVAEEPVRGRSFKISVPLPRRDVTVRVTAFDAAGKRASAVVGPVFGLPHAAAPRSFRSSEDPVLARRVRALVRGFPGTAAVVVQDLRTGRGAAWNARARFPAASTLKLAIALEVLRALRGPPRPGSWLARTLGDMLVHSDNKAANGLEIWLGGSTSGGAAKVNATMRALRLFDSHMYGGYAVETGAGRPLPLEVESQPAFGLGKYTTAWDLARLDRYLHLAAAHRGPLPRLPGSFTAADARRVLFTLAHVRDPGKLDRYMPRSRVAVLHKAGWITHARHDSGIVYWQGGAFVATVMTWNGLGAGLSSDVLAGRTARAGLRRFTQTAPRSSAAADLAQT